MNGRYGLAVSAFIHIVILSIPFSMTVKRPIEETEIFIIDEERPEPKVIKKDEILKVSKESKTELKEIQEFRKIEEKISKQEKNIAESPGVEEKPIMNEKNITESVVIPPLQSVEKPASQENKIIESTIISHKIDELKDIKKEVMSQLLKESKTELKEIQEFRKIEEKISKQDIDIQESPNIEEKPVINKKNMVNSVIAPTSRSEEKPLVQEKKMIEPTLVSERANVPLLPVEDRLDVPKVRSLPSSDTEDNPRSGVVSQQPRQPHGYPSNEIFREVGFGTTVGPKFLHKELPVYPAFARRLGKEGKVILRLSIDERGELLNIEVIEGAGYGFVEAALEAVKRSTFLPAKKDGKPIPSRAILPISFELRRN